MRSAAPALLVLGGCLIVRTSDEPVDDAPCPETFVAPLAQSAGPIAIIDDTIYFARPLGDLTVSEMLSTISTSGGPITDLAALGQGITGIAVDATDVYVTNNGSVLRGPRSGGGLSIVAAQQQLTDLIGSTLLIDPSGVLFGASGGIYRLRRSDGMLERIVETGRVPGLAALGSDYVWSDYSNDVVRRGPPGADLASMPYPGPLAADDLGIYVLAGAAVLGNPGTIQLVSPQGGTPIETAALVGAGTSIVIDADSVYLALLTNYGYRIQRVSRFGGEVTSLACGNFAEGLIYLRQDLGHIYWSNSRNLYRLAKPGAK